MYCEFPPNARACARANRSARSKRRGLNGTSTAQCYAALNRKQTKKQTPRQNSHTADMVRLIHLNPDPPGFNGGLVLVKSTRLKEMWSSSPKIRVRWFWQWSSWFRRCHPGGMIPTGIQTWQLTPRWTICSSFWTCCGVGRGVIFLGAPRWLLRKIRCTVKEVAWERPCRRWSPTIRRHKCHGSGRSLSRSADGSKVLNVSQRSRLSVVIIIIHANSNYPPG